jgi:hypothetical protein
MNMTATTNDKLDLVKYVPILGPGVDALESRKEYNDHPRVTASELRESFNKVKVALFAGLAALVK